MRRIGISLLLAWAAMGGSLQAAPTGDLPPVGTFDSKGIYHPPARRERFSRLHGEDPRAAVPRYPVVLVHGQGGFDRIRIGRLYGDYFNGVAKRLRRDGIQVLTTVTPPFGTIKERAALLKEQLLATGWEKMNLVCHSMGGLDSRYLVTHLGMADRIASITTVGTPHHGSWYADWVLEWVFEKQHFWKVWDLLGIPRTSIPELTVKFLEGEFNPSTPDMPQVRYFSVGGNQNVLRVILPFKGAKLIMKVIEKRAVGQPLSRSERLAERILIPKAARRQMAAGPAAMLGALGVNASWVVPELAGQNDCQVSVSSARWGEYLGTLDADHFDQPGWFGSFNAPRFFRGIAQMLADAGY